MNGVRAANIIRKYTKQDSTTLPDSELAEWFNQAKDEICQEAEEINEGYFSMEFYRNLVAGQRQYTLPVDMLSRLEKVAIKFPTWDDYRVVEEVRLSVSPNSTSETTITTSYVDSAPKMLLRRESIYFLTGSAIPDMTDGIQLWAKVFPNDISATTLAQTFDLSVAPFSDGVGIPRALHSIICLRTSILYKQNRDRPIALNDTEQNYEFLLRKALNAINGQNLARSISPQFPYDDGSTY